MVYTLTEPFEMLSTHDCAGKERALRRGEIDKGAGYF